MQALQVTPGDWPDRAELPGQESTQTLCRHGDLIVAMFRYWGRRAEIVELAAPDGCGNLFRYHVTEDATGGQFVASGSAPTFTVALKHINRIMKESIR